jgi:hypothetical protein
MNPLTIRSKGRRSWLGATAVALLFVTACGGDAISDPPTNPGPFDADTAVIRVDHVGGFVAVTEIVGRLPVVSVHGDGRVITEGPVPAIYPGPALPNVQQQKIPPERVGALVRMVLDSAVATDTDFGRPSVTDAATTRVTVTTSEGVRRLEVYALDLPTDDLDGGLTEAQRAARKKLTDLIAELQNQAASEPYPVTALAAIASPYPNPIPADLPSPPPAVAWAGPTLPGDAVGPGAVLGCVAVTGDAARAVLATAATANAATPWTSGGRTWSLRLRPLLPDESGCADLAARQ